MNKNQSTSELNAMQGIAYGWQRYRGPKPPKGTTHRYRFTILALDRRLRLPVWATYRKFMRVTQDCVVGHGEVIGEFE